MSKEITNTDEFDKYVEENNVEVVTPEDNELLLDLDSKEDVAFFNEQLEILKQIYNVKRVTYTTSKSGNTHAYVVLKEKLPTPERIALQACLGSDRTKEILSFKRFRRGDPRPVILFEVKQCV